MQRVALSILFTKCKETPTQKAFCIVLEASQMVLEGIRDGVGGDPTQEASLEDVGRGPPDPKSLRFLL